MKIEFQMYFSKDIPGVNPVVMNCKIRQIGLQRGQRGIVVHDQTAFSVICGGIKTGKHSLDMRGYVQG